MRFATALAVAATCLASPAGAIVRGEVARDPDGVRESVVRVESSRGELCSGAVIAPDLVLTAAHCVLEPARYRVIGVDRRFRPEVVRAVAAAMHPAFVPGTTPRTQPGIDLAILKLERPLSDDFRPLDPRRAAGIRVGEEIQVAGFGTTAYQLKRTARTLRQTRLVSLGELQVANRVLVAVDGERLAARTGAGACQGDSGGPLLREARGGYQLVGIVSWSSGAFEEPRPTACGGLTAVTPVAEHLPWIGARAADLSRYAAAPPFRARATANRYDWVAR